MVIYCVDCCVGGYGIGDGVGSDICCVFGCDVCYWIICILG